MKIEALLKFFWSFLKVRKKYWLLPIFIMLFIVIGMILFSGSSFVAPFLYTLF